MNTPPQHLINLAGISNGAGVQGYGGRLEAYSFAPMAIKEWFEEFESRILSAVGNHYLPVYRMADGEFHFLFGPRINFRRERVRSVLRVVKYRLLNSRFQTCWGESYDPRRLKSLRMKLAAYLRAIAKHGCLALYWNENGLHAYNEHNDHLQRSFGSLGVELNRFNYVPFHFVAGLVAKAARRLFSGRVVLIASSIDDVEYARLAGNLRHWGAKSVERWKCSERRALTDDLPGQVVASRPDIILVAAGIGSARFLVDFQKHNCPVLDIGGYMHVLSGANASCHSGFFYPPS